MDRPSSSSSTPRRRPWRRPLAAISGGTALLAFAAIQLRIPTPLPPAPGAGEVRVATYNIRAGLGGLDRVSEDLRRLSPDVVALQEVERGVRRSRRVDQAESLGTTLGMQAAYAGSFRIQSGEHGIAILSRWPIARADTLRLPRGSGRWPRVALLARIEAPTGPFLFVCVHLARPFGWPISNTRARLDQLDAVLDGLAGSPVPVVVAGDFNSLPISPEGWKIRRALHAAWNPWRDGWAPTFSLRNLGWPAGAIKIDHVYHDERWRSAGVWVSPPGASDHRAVIADLAPEG